VVKVAREHGESRSQANLFIASERSRSLCRFARRRGKPPFRVGESASERRLVSLMCEGLGFVGAKSEGRAGSLGRGRSPNTADSYIGSFISLGVGLEDLMPLKAPSAHDS
jgi:hypothetical protein